MCLRVLLFVLVCCFSLLFVVVVDVAAHFSNCYRMSTRVYVFTRTGQEDMAIAGLTEHLHLLNVVIAGGKSVIIGADSILVWMLASRAGPAICLDLELALARPRQH